MIEIPKFKPHQIFLKINLISPNKVVVKTIVDKGPEVVEEFNYFHCVQEREVIKNCSKSTGLIESFSPGERRMQLRFWEGRGDTKYEDLDIPSS